MLNPWVSVLRDASLQTLSYDNVEHALRYSASVTDAELVLDGDGHRYQAEHGDDHEPPLEAEVAVPLWGPSIFDVRGFRPLPLGLTYTTDVHPYSDTIGTGPKCHCKQESL